MTRKDQCVPGAVLTVTKLEYNQLQLVLDQHEATFNVECVPLALGDRLVVVKKPRRATAGINLTRLRRISDGAEGEVWWIAARYCTTPE